jgi:hypothetical protein
MMVPEMKPRGCLPSGEHWKCVKLDYREDAVAWGYSFAARVVVLGKGRAISGTVSFSELQNMTPIGMQLPKILEKRIADECEKVVKEHKDREDRCRQYWKNMGRRRYMRRIGVLR